MVLNEKDESACTLNVVQARFDYDVWKNDDILELQSAQKSGKILLIME